MLGHVGLGPVRLASSMGVAIRHVGYRLGSRDRCVCLSRFDARHLDFAVWNSDCHYLLIRRFAPKRKGIVVNATMVSHAQLGSSNTGMVVFPKRRRLPRRRNRLRYAKGRVTQSNPT